MPSKPTRASPGLHPHPPPAIRPTRCEALAGAAAAGWRRPPGRDHGAGHTSGRQPELAAARPRGPTLLEDFILREKITHFDHERIPSASCMHAAAPAWLLRAHRVAREVHTAKILTETGKRTPCSAASPPWRVAQARWIPARRARLRRQVLHERGPLGLWQQHTRADRRGATGPARVEFLWAARRVRSAGQPVSAAQLHSVSEHRRDAYLDGVCLAVIDQCTAASGCTAPSTMTVILRMLSRRHRQLGNDDPVMRLR